MKIKIENVLDKGNLERERVILKVVSDENIGNYVIMDSTFDQEGDVSNTGRHGYKFSSKEVKKGDFICLFTKNKDGSSKSEFKNTTGSTTHCFFWGRWATIWNKDSDCFYLMYLLDSRKV